MIATTNHYIDSKKLKFQIYIVVRRQLFMANFRALTSQLGVSTQIQDANTLIVGFGVTTNAGTNLSITAGGTNTITFGSLISSNITFDNSISHTVLPSVAPAATSGVNLTVDGGSGGVATASPAGAGGLLVLQAGNGGNGLAGVAGAAGGIINLQGGTGGNGTATAAGGVGGNALINGGVGGTNNGGGGANGGNVTINGGAATGSATNGSVSIGSLTTSAVTITPAGALTLTAGAASIWSTTAGALSISGFAGVIVQGASVSITPSGAVTITAGASSVWETTVGSLTIVGATVLSLQGASVSMTSPGAITITAGAPSTWSTSAGILTVSSAAALNLNGVSGINLQGNGVNALVVNSTGTAITVQTGATLNTTGTGQINLPQNFLISGVATTYATPGTGQVTSLNLNTLTAGPASIADSLHNHANIFGSLVLQGLNTSAFTPVTDNGLLTYFSGNSVVARANATVASTAIAVGVYEGIGGQITYGGGIADAKFIAGLTLAAGNRVYLSKTDGNFTNDTTGFSSGNVIMEVGVVSDASAYNGTSALTAKVLLTFKAAVLL
jgi:hypothetical protein